MANPAAPPVTIYTRPLCGYCAAALDLLRRKGVAFEEIAQANRPEVKAEMVQRANGRSTFPQIFVGGRHVGGFDDLSALERQGRLDAMVAEASAG